MAARPAPVLRKNPFRVYFRSEYGPGRLDYPLIPSTGVESFDSFILRAGYNDSWIHWDDMERYVAVYISDQLGRDVHSDMGFVASHGIYAELFLNGEYWGLYNLCERIEGEFLTSYYGFDDWDIISDDELKEGDWTEWNRLHNFINRSDLSNPDNYQTFQEMVDLKQITSYYILNIWVQNHDWPHHNWYAARERHPQGRWKLIVWDIEDSFGSGASRGSYNMNTFANAQGNNSIGNLFRALLKNPEYQIYFANELERYLSGPLSEEHLLKRLDEHADIVRATMPKEALRWNPTKSIDDWENALEIARTFIRNRTAYVRQHVYRVIDVSTPTPTPAISEATPTPGPPTPTSTPLPAGSVIGIFDNHADIGSVLADGDAFYEEENRQYTVIGSGADVWDQSDGFHFLYKEVSDDFVLEVKIDGENFGTSDWAKLMIMVRQSLDHDAAHYAARFQESNFQASSQWRTTKGASAGSTPSGDRISSLQHDNRLRLARKGDRFETYYFNVNNNQWTLLDSLTVPLTDPIYAGFAVTSHDDGNLAKGYFTQVQFEGATVSIPQWRMY